MHSILHEHLNVKKICSRWIPPTLSIAQKKARGDWCKKMLKTFYHGAEKDVYKITTDEETSMRMSSKQNNAKSDKSCSKQIVACFFKKPGHILLENQ